MVTVSAAQNDEAMPAHIAIIMDGNGRWAKARGLPRAEGHRRGAEAVRRVVEGDRIGVSKLRDHSGSALFHRELLAHRLEGAPR